jgi:uncharacterized protein (TIGR03382 family)
MNDRTATAAGAALLLLVLVVHFRYHDLAAWLYPERAEYASRALFYVLRGVSGALVFAALMLLAPPAILLRIACAVGMFAEGATAFCRASYPLDHPIPAGANAGGLCDAATREPVTAMLAGGVAVSLLWLGRKQKGAQ